MELFKPLLLYIAQLLLGSKQVDYGRLHKMKRFAFLAFDKFGIW
jgi:hypothetical protein